ncbi:hypothetical protein SAMN05518672_101279 [Chitinophaga sp. CF118]|uniref:hypothetical protein n=1 Tax=Chitinophaga sp. CF118 TaxID=1884367 RepID=UPI0008EE372A|nr:hypothetical protein [Chitinophaga sp. CF118]SFD06139.1 hypothetical protein SAMN05518672_101279 [Chitinophaga sp. CF118]
MQAFTIKHNADRYDVRPLNKGNSQRFKVNVGGKTVYFENDVDGHVRAEVTNAVSTSLLMALADKIEENGKS